MNCAIIYIYIYCLYRGFGSILCAIDFDFTTFLVSHVHVGTSCSYVTECFGLSSVTVDSWLLYRDDLVNIRRSRGVLHT